MKNSFLKFAILGVFIVLVISQVLADDDAKEKRKLKIEFSSKDADLKIESDSEVGKDKDKFDFEVDTNEMGKHPKIKVKYYTSSEDSKAKFEYRVMFFELIEFVDNDGVGYTPNATVKQVYDLGTNGWTATQSAVANNSTGETVYTYTFSETNGAFSFNAIISGADFTAEGMTLTPDQIKISVLVQSFNWKCGASEKCSLALSAVVQTALKVKKQKDNDSGSDNQITVEDDDGQTAGYFQWLNEVQLLGSNTADVKTTNLTPSTVNDNDSQNMGAQKMYFSFIQTAGQSRIYWDPIIGVGESSGIAVVASCLTFVLVLFALLF